MKPGRFPIWCLLFIGHTSLGMAADGVDAKKPIPASEPTAQAQPFKGTLFQSEAERAKLNRMFATGRVNEPSITPESVSMITGIVQRGSSGTTVWVDGQLVGELDSVLASKVSSSMVGNPSGARLVSSATVEVQDRPALNPKGRTMPKLSNRKKPVS